MSNLITFPRRESTTPERPAVAFIPISTPHDEHACTRQARILQAWLIDCASDPDVDPDWVIERLQQAIQWTAMRKIFSK